MHSMILNWATKYTGVIPVTALFSCVNLDNSGILSEPQFLHL